MKQEKAVRLAVVMSLRRCEGMRNKQLQVDFLRDMDRSGWEVMSGGQIC